MCLYPRIIQNRKYTATKKNKGIIPKMKDKRVQFVPVGCGKCMECKRQKSNDWRIRLMEEIRHKNNGIFVTLTFSNESIKELSKGIKLNGYELDNEIATLAVRRFLERWRKKYKKSVRHWLVTELGHNGTENIHLHGIIWTDIEPKEIKRIWQYGYTWLSTDNKGYVNEQTVNYIVKYITKTDLKHKEYNSKILTSNGIGKRYTERTDIINNRYKGKETNESYRTRNGRKYSLPIYYRNKIYTEEEKEKLWINKLDEKIRWVNKQKIDISEGEEDYYRALKDARELNKLLNYGDNEINWERRIYENQRRNMKHMERIKNAKR